MPRHEEQSVLDEYTKYDGKLQNIERKLDLIFNNYKNTITYQIKEKSNANGRSNTKRH